MMRQVSVEQLSLEALDALRKEGYKESTLVCVKKIHKQIIRAHHIIGATNFEQDIFSEYLGSLKNKYESGHYVGNRYLFITRCAGYMEQIWLNGMVDTTPRREYPDVPESFKKQFFDDYVAAVSPKHHKKYAWRIRPYLLWLNRNGYDSISNVDENVIRAYMLDCSRRMRPNSLNNERLYLKQFHRFIFTKGLAKKDFSLIFANPVASERRIKKPIPQEEIAAIFKVIDRSTAEGKRRYAMFMLGAITGLRGVDIIKLKRTDIDWQKGEICITQSKTSKSLALPLTEDVGEAIKDYLLNARPDCEYDTVFLTQRAPYKPYVIGRSVGDIYDRERAKAGFEKSGVHGLRRSLAKSMITAGVPSTTVAQVLGDKKLDSITPYLAVDTENLAECSLGFEDIPFTAPPKSTFISGLSNDIESFFEYRVGMGFKKKPYIGIIRKFDAYCAEKFPGLSVMTQEAVIGWWSEYSTESKTRMSCKAGAIRMLGKYLMSMGKEAYILPTNMVAKKSSFVPYILSDDELKSLFYQMDIFDARGGFAIFSDVVTPVMFRLMYTCGLRPNEVRMLKCVNINLSNGEILVTNTKRNKERIVVMSPEMLSLCRAYEVKRLLFDKEGKWFFPRKPGAPYVSSQMERIIQFCWAKANPKLKKKDLPRLRPYDLRHRFASAVLHKWLDEGRDLYAMLPYLRTHMGHSKLEDTAYYVHILPENLLKSRGVNWEELDDVSLEADVWQR